MMKSYLIVVLLLARLAAAQRTDDADDQAGVETAIRSKPVVIRLPKNQLSPEIEGISSLREDIRAKIDGRNLVNIESDASSPAQPPQTPIGRRPVLPVSVQQVPHQVPQVGPTHQIPPQQVGAPARPQITIQRQPQIQAPTQPIANPLASLANSPLASASGLSGILSSNPSLLKLLGGLGGSNGLTGGLAGAPSAGPPGLNFGQGGLLGPLQGSLPGLSQPPPFPGGGIGAPPGTPDAGLLNVISSLGRQLGGAVGLNNIIPGTGGASQVGPSIPRIAGLAGPPIAGIPNIPGLPVFPGAITPGGQLDVLQLVSAISRRALNGTSVTEVLPPNQIQKLADNLTDTLIPDTTDIDLNKYMGRWFEGISSPRASDQRCVVHHYGGLTENGKTATFTALKIYREASEFGQVRYSIGYAFRGGRQEGMLQMHTSESPDPVPYWVYKAGPVGKDPFGNEQYEYAIVSNWIRYPVFVLVRDPDQFKRDHEESVLRWLEEKGFINGFVRAFNLVQPISYQNCQYADSTFELFG